MDHDSCELKDFPDFKEFEIMSYFDGLSDGLCKTDKDGNLIFYPWGILGKGYILPDEHRKKRIKRFKSFYHKISLRLTYQT